MSGGVGRTPAIGLVLVGLACQEVGASIAVLLFPQAGPLGMVMMRLFFAAVVLLLIARPSLRGRSVRAWRSVVWFGVVLAVMNGLFYLALERLPLGVTVTIEVLGPLVLSIVAARRAAAWLWALLAFAGVVALGGGGWDRLDFWGVLFALGAAASWALYILASAETGRQTRGLDGLALAMSVGALLSLPFGWVDAGTALLRPEILALGFAVAMLSSMVPYALELIALRRVTASVFGILMTLGPATASLAGFLLLGQGLNVLEIFGIVLVIAASMGAVLTAPKPVSPSTGAPDDPFGEPVA
ncbi:MAG: EamA family transporter [Microbacterium sp.]|uniref:EamA family transporter n=1 Tax=Microbacterium sp. TaxID=51671 RepID=UPI00261A3D0A|nr:EamA family transporter [Microbacterium sp.]MCX6502982.1 EamA family transporter [Microbacterium sp.]